MKKLLSRLLDHFLPWRLCERIGHDWRQSYRSRAAEEISPLGAAVVRVPDLQCWHCGAYHSDLYPPEGGDDDPPLTQAQIDAENEQIAGRGW